MTQLLITTGPESSGKTTLATALSAALRAPLVTEAARDYLEARCAEQPDFQYEQSDILAIARLQHAREREALRDAPPLIVCDTDLLVLIVWSEVKYGQADPAIVRLFESALATTSRTYLLCHHGIPWQPDPLREHPHERDMLFARYLAALRQRGLDYRIVEGDEATRLALACPPAMTSAS